MCICAKTMFIKDFVWINFFLCTLFCVQSTLFCVCVNSSVYFSNDQCKNVFLLSKCLVNFVVSDITLRYCILYVGNITFPSETKLDLPLLKSIIVLPCKQN